MWKLSFFFAADNNQCVFRLRGGFYTLNSHVFAYFTLSQLLIAPSVNNVASPMFPQTWLFVVVVVVVVVFRASGGPTPLGGTLRVCFPPEMRFVLFVYRLRRNVLDERSQRSGRCARRRHGHHQRRGQPCARRGKERILHLDCRGS